jgi:hypothetical protein
MAKEKTPAEIRAERIANLKDPIAIENIKKIEEERAVEIAKLREYQRENLEKWVKQVEEQRYAARNGPQFTPPGMKEKPVITKTDDENLKMDARAEVQRQIKVQEQAKQLSFDRRVDRELDASDRRMGGPSHDHDRTLDRGGR